MGLLAKCPRCSTMYMPGQPCPSCNYREGSETAAGEAAGDVMEQYAHRKSWHQFAYAAYMVRGLAVGTMGLALVLMCWIGAFAAIMMVLIGAGVAVVAQLLLFAARSYRELHCPACDTRLDELPLDNGRCPGCQARLVGPSSA